MKRAAIATAATTVFLALAGAGLAVLATPVAAAGAGVAAAVCAIVTLVLGLLASRAQDEGRRLTEAALGRAAEERETAWEHTVRSLERDLAQARAQSEAVAGARTALAEAVSLLRETAPIIEGLARKAIEKSEHGSTSLTEDVYELGRRSTSLGQSIAGFLTELSTGDESLQSNLGELTADAERLTEIAHLCEQADVSLDNSITRISQSVGDTSELVAKVSDIAEQTSILAINAAIYAAKAGEFGQGFSVIAGEIQKLAGTAKTVAETIGVNTLTIEKQVSDFSATHRRLMTDSRTSLTATIESLRHTIAGLEPKIDRISASIKTAAQVSASVTDQLNDINVAMQEQDAIQQIVAHITDILNSALEKVPASVVAEAVSTSDGRIRNLAREMAVRHFTMQDEFVAVQHDGYDADARSTTVLEDGTELGGDVTLF